MVAGTHGSLNKAGSTKMTQISTTAGIDTSKAKLDIAVHGRIEHWQVENALVGWRRLVAALTGAEVTRVGIEASGGYECGVVDYLLRQKASDLRQHRRSARHAMDRKTRSRLMVATALCAINERSAPFAVWRRAILNKKTAGRPGSQ